MQESSLSIILLLFCTPLIAQTSPELTEAEWIASVNALNEEYFSKLEQLRIQHIDKLEQLRKEATTNVILPASQRLVESNDAVVTNSRR